MADKATPVIETINIKEVTQHSSKNNKKFWKVITVDDEYYTTWKQDVKDRLQDGLNTVSVEINDTGDMTFKNIVGIAPAPQVDGKGYLETMGAPTPAAHAAPSQQTTPPAQALQPPQNPQQATGLQPIQQVRAAALQIAAYMVASGVIATTELVAMSERNVKYILEGAGEPKNSSVPASDYVER